MQHALEEGWTVHQLKLSDENNKNEDIGLNISRTNLNILF